MLKRLSLDKGKKKKNKKKKGSCKRQFEAKQSKT